MQHNIFEAQQRCDGIVALPGKYEDVKTVGQQYCS
mgnify:CR=1 FL=1